jgi:broad specificity phosphatase PhoE
MEGPAPAKARIVLVRHGRSSHVHRGWVTAAGLRVWRQAYEAAGIRRGERPPAALRRLARDAKVVACSDAPRAVASARLLAAGQEVVVSPLLRELDLEGPALGALRLPLAAWAVVVGGRMAALAIRRRNPLAAEAARADAAATWLEALAAPHAIVVAVTHGSFRRLLAASLVRNGWHVESGKPSVRHWSAWGLVRRRRSTHARA